MDMKARIKAAMAERQAEIAEDAKQALAQRQHEKDIRNKEFQDEMALLAPVREVVERTLQEFSGMPDFKRTFGGKFRISLQTAADNAAKDMPGTSAGSITITSRASMMGYQSADFAYVITLGLNGTPSPHEHEHEHVHGNLRCTLGFMKLDHATRSNWQSIGQAVILDTTSMDGLEDRLDNIEESLMQELVRFTVEHKPPTRGWGLG